MVRRIDRDQQRFDKIIKGKVRQQLRKYINHGEMIGRKGRETVSIPVPNIEIPHFQHGEKGSGGVGQGDGEVGEAIGRGKSDGDGQGQAGNDRGQHIREVELSLEELADMLGEALELPRIEPKGDDQLTSEKDRYTSIRPTGPDSLRHFKRTYKRALRRMMATDNYDPKDPVIVPAKDDERYRSWKTVSEPHTNAAVIYMMDVSGSMTDVQKEIVRTESFWIDTWLKRQYNGIERRYIVHDAVAHEVDEDTFYRIRESGGTRISSAYRAADQIIKRDFPPSMWNIYCFQFSDGDNWGEDNSECIESLKQNIIPICNLFCYGQVRSPYGSGDFIKELRKVEEEFENLILSEIEDKEGIYGSIKTFLGTGK
ncbi:DUF444 family protein [uncultured Gimesia sp.]|mgnify:FL=1|uniref:DUF444 family protein n=1 Tax=uncultured Gimesia sp. TaxID=1678688 RepID=UPI00260CD15D|nr:DUF444 family protein [uncultured Gimesia sp.]